MSYTLTGRLETRLAAAVPALLLAFALQRWWAIELVALMLALGAVLDLAYDRALDYQPAWLALPLGAFELGIVYGAMRALHITAPLNDALALYAVAWLSAQLFAHAILPRLRLEYAEGGGELGRSGAVTAAAVALALVGGLGAAYATRIPTVHLHGTIQGPLVITRSETLVGGVVRGGIDIRANHVTLRRVTVVGGDYGINIEHVEHVKLDRVRVLHAKLDAIRAWDAAVMIKDCSISAPGSEFTTGVLISYSMGRPMSMVEGCTIAGTREGISTHSSMVSVMGNHVIGTTTRAISLSEMSMDMASHNTVEGASGVGIVCMDHSMCEIEHNTIAGSKPMSGNPSASGVAIESYYFSEAKVSHNTVIASPGGIQAFDNSLITKN
jgi:hypothetical protein